ncbi:esterase, partial [Paraburkholderia sp. SIMBA_061]
RSSTRAATRPATTTVAKPSVKVRQTTTRDVPQRGARESRVRPRAAAWASGSWTRSFHSAPAAPGSLINHLQYGLYLPAGKPIK